jgi:hypothetical protein
MNPTDRHTRAAVIPIHRNSIYDLLEMHLQAGGWEGMSNQSTHPDYAFCSTPTRLAVGLRQSGLNRCLDIRPEILRSFLGSPFSSCLFNEPKAKKKLGYMDKHDRIKGLSSQDVFRMCTAIINTQLTVTCEDTRLVLRVGIGSPHLAYRREHHGVSLQSRGAAESNLPRHEIDPLPAFG